MDTALKRTHPSERRTPLLLRHRRFKLLRLNPLLHVLKAHALNGIGADVLKFVG